mgnify:CR=1 FL=1
MLLTTLEVAEKYGISIGYVRLLARTKKIKGREARISKSRSIWLVEEQSVKAYLKKDRKRGPKPKKRNV